MTKKPRLFELTSTGEIRPAFTYGSATVQAANAAEARTLFLRFAYKAAEEPPRVRATPRAYQLSRHTPLGLVVEAGPLTRTDSKGFLFSACIAGSYDDQRPENVKPEAASFDYYDGPEYNQEN